MTENEAESPRPHDAGTDPEEAADRETAHARWIPGPSVLEARLPEDVQRRLGELLGRDQVATLGDWVTQIRAHSGGGSIDVGALCHADEETPHWGERADKRYYFLCFYDAVILAALADEPVHIRTRSPGGDVIEARAAGSADLTVRPEEAVFSFGVEADLEPPANGAPSPADVYAAVCPFVRAFPDFAAYRDWAATVSAASVAMPLSGATDLAAALVD